MHEKLLVSVGQYSDAGRKAINQDCLGCKVPSEPLLSSKGIAIAIADGISSSDVSQIASQTAVSSFLEDYYCSSDAWSVKTSALKILYASNAWLYAQTRNSPHRFNKDKGYICTFSAMVLKGQTAHVFHCGDSRIYRLSANNLEPLTTDHCHNVDAETSYLTRALGIHESLDIDYFTLPLERGDIFVLSTDGVHDYLDSTTIAQTINEYSDDLDGAAQKVSEHALAAGSTDNISLQIIKLDQLPVLVVDEVEQQLNALSAPPPLEARKLFEGYMVKREIAISSRSHVYLAQEPETGLQLVIKTPSMEMKNNKAYLESFLMEDWIAKRINNPHVLKAVNTDKKKNYLYTVSEYVDGQSLDQWMLDNPEPSLDEVRSILEQVAKGLQAMHRQEMVHQDLRPKNIMIDTSGTVKLIDFGSVKVAGVSELKPNNEGIVGTLQYSAPEYFIHQSADHRADIYSLGVIAYEMLSKRFPYGLKVSNARSKAQQHKLRYRSLVSHDQHVPYWFEAAIQKAVSVNPFKRYVEVSEFIYDLKHPNKLFINRQNQPLIERNPIVFWQSLTVILVLVILAQSYFLLQT